MDLINQGWFGIVVGLIFNILVAAVYRRIGPAPTALSYVVSPLGTYHVISSPGRPSALMDRLELRFDNQVLSSLEMFGVTVWNGRPSGIDGSALIQRDPFRLTVRYGRILAAEMISNPNTDCGFALDVKDSSVGVKFDFVARSQGVALLVFTIPSWRTSVLDIAGTLKNTRLVRWPSPKDAFPLQMYKQPIFTALAISFVLAGIGFIASFFVPETWKGFFNIVSWFTFFFWQGFAFIPFEAAAMYFRAGYHIPADLR